MTARRPSQTVRIARHPTLNDVVLLKVPVSANEHMGRFEPAQLDRELHAFVVLADHLDAFQRFADMTGWLVLDERLGRTPLQHRRDRLCDICMKPEALCQRSAGNRGPLRDHDYLPAIEADAMRLHERSRAREIAQWAASAVQAP